MEMMYFSKNRLAYLLKCSVEALPTAVKEYLKEHPLSIDIKHYMMLPHIDRLSVQLRKLGAKVESCDNIDLLILVLGKTLNGIYIPTNDIDTENIVKSDISYGFKEEFKDYIK